MPDVYYRLLGVSGWLELKFRSTWPARDGPVTLKTLTTEQVRWLEAERRAGGLAWILALISNEYLIPAPAHWEAIATTGVSKKELVSEALYYGAGTAGFSAGRIVRVLIGKPARTKTAGNDVGGTTAC